jgi:hypothetical protein
MIQPHYGGAAKHRNSNNFDSDIQKCEIWNREMTGQMAGISLG